jgi:hypothetical protein
MGERKGEMGSLDTQSVDADKYRPQDGLRRCGDASCYSRRSLPTLVPPFRRFPRPGTRKVGNSHVRSSERHAARLLGRPSAPTLLLWRCRVRYFPSSSCS